MAKSPGTWTTSPIPEASRVAAFALALCLGACSSDGGDLASLIKTARGDWAAPSAPLRRDGRPAMAIRIGDGREQMLTLAGDESLGKQLWSSPARVAIETRNGRIVRTAGLDHDLAGFTSDETSPSAPQSWDRRRVFQWTADFADLGVYAAPVSCEDIPHAPQTVRAEGKAVRVFRVDETCHCAQLDWNFANVFWVDVSGNFVRRSIQHVHPRLDAVDLMIVAATSRDDVGR